MRPSPFTLEEERYLTTQLSQGDDRVATKALQWMCHKARNGFFFTDTSKLRPVIRLCLHRSSPNARRWALNALSLIGVGSDLTPILSLVPASEDDPDLLAAIVSAIFSKKSDDEATALLALAQVPLNGLALIAASQFSLAKKRRLVELMVPLESADAAELRAAIVLTGTGKAPEHLFHRKQTNAIALSELNLHDVSSVSKYSIWALAQLKLGFSSLLLPISDVEGSADEIRKWIFRLLFSDQISLAKNLDLIEVAQRDSSIEVREESAIELRDSFVPGMESAVSNWFFQEEQQEVRLSLLDHMAAQSEKSEEYTSIVTELYRDFAPRSDKRVRLEAAAAKTTLYRVLRKIDHEDENGLLFANDNEAGGKMVTIHQNFTGSQIGSVTATGAISAETINAVGKQSDPNTKILLERVLSLLLKLSSPEARTEGERIVTEIANEPTRSGWQKLLGFLNGAKEGAQAIGGTLEGADGIIDNISRMIG